MFVMKTEPFLCRFQVPAGYDPTDIDEFDIDSVYEFIKTIASISEFESKTLSIKFNKIEKYAFFNVSFIEENRIIIKFYHEKIIDSIFSPSEFSFTVCDKIKYKKNCNFIIEELNKIFERRVK